jgi:hypothetical protein
MTDDDIKNLIFLQGFSTNEKVTDISGRGVGMDVVKSEIKFVDNSKESKVRTLVVVDVFKDDVLVAFITSNLQYSGVLLDEDSLTHGHL